MTAPATAAPRRRPRLPARTLTALAAGSVLAGCAVQPVPMTSDEARAALAEQRSVMFADQPALEAPLTLEEAAARTIKYNLDHRVKLMEQALSQRQLDLASFDLLPKLAADAGYSWRSNERASSSRDLVTGEQSLVPSTSSERVHDTAGLTLSWNVLDFGVSYYGAKQQADRVLVMRERRRKVVHQLMQQLRQAYWQAVGAQQVEGKIQPLLEMTRSALADSRRIEREKLLPPLEALNYQRQLLELVRQLEAVRDELAQAKPRLAAMMNVAPSLPFTLAAPEALPLPRLAVEPAAMEETALLQRPEMVEAGYQERISLLETKKALARVLPGVSIELGAQYDNDSYLVNNSWRETGLRVSWNLLNLLNYGNIRDAAQAQHEIARQQRLALSMAVLTQVHIAYRDLQGRQRQYELADELNQVDQGILEHTRNAAAASAQGQLAAIRAQAGAVMSELRLYQSYGALQNAYGQMLMTLGQDPLPDTLPAHDLATLRAAFAERERQAQPAQKQP
ncbi:outer membrane protein TolC [Rubrivivax gelatinosus]|uniref:TolC family protein n=2 Tax=Rubrivivax gelatinosus TaxID=28068 RepID=UPI0018CA18BA|nr:TolC family protein [Rubrivivax gelatinosus]MBG6079083.1 outer membrane protein TolC [Rubrivivax gelatinosus]